MKQFGNRTVDRAIYVALAYVYLAPILREIQRVLPVKLNEADWRFGAAGFLLAALSPSVLALAGALLFAFIRGHQRIAWGIGVLSLVTALFAVAGVGTMLLDWGAVAAQVPQAGKAVLRATAVGAIGTAILGVAAFVVVFLSARGLVRHLDEQPPPVR